MTHPANPTALQTAAVGEIIAAVELLKGREWDEPADADGEQAGPSGRTIDRGELKQLIQRAQNEARFASLQKRPEYAPFPVLWPGEGGRGHERAIGAVARVPVGRCLQVAAAAAKAEKAAAAAAAKAAASAAAAAAKAAAAGGGVLQEAAPVAAAAAPPSVRIGPVSRRVAPPGPQERQLLKELTALAEQTMEDGEDEEDDDDDEEEAVAEKK